MLNESVFMIRNGSMATNYELKLFFTIIALIIVVIDWKRKSRLDYLWVFIVGAIIWTIVEFLLQVRGIRDITDASLFGIKLPILGAAVLRGCMEGAFIGVLGVFIGDGLSSDDRKEKRIFIGIFIGFLLFFIFQTVLQAVPSMDVGGDVGSRRDIFFPVIAIPIVSFATLNILWLWKRANAETRRRALYMYFVMAIIGTVWTIFEVLANTRWIEVGTSTQQELALPWVFFGAFAYDIIIEIAAAYVPFLLIPFMLNLIKQEDKRIKIKKDAIKQPIGESIPAEG